jgi:dihydrolipoamide dehydrogenase
VTALEVKVPDIGDFEGVPVVEVLVAEGDEVAAEDSLVVLESDKATMEVPAPSAGTVSELRVKVGDEVSEGDVLCVLETAEGDADGEATPEPHVEEKPAAEPEPETTQATERGDEHAQVLVLGSGPGGYTAAFRAADLGLDVVLVERHAVLGGVCLNVGCIPSKALLHVARVIAEAEEVSGHGVAFAEPEIDLDALRAWKDGVVGQLTKGVEGLAKARKVRVVHGVGRFASDHLLAVDTGEGTTTISFDHAVVAAGSHPVALPDLPDDSRIVDSTGALELADVPERLLVVGGGIIGLEMATVYDALGSKVTVVELADQLIPGCDPDLVKPLRKRIEARYEAIHLKTKVASASAGDDGIAVTFEGDDAPESQTFDRVLVAVGRAANGADLGLDAAGVEVDERGQVRVDERLRTNVPHIHAIGDLVGGPMLAHKATHEAKVAAEVIAGEDVVFDVRGIPSVAYTDPEIAWVGLTETQAKADGTEYELATFPWSASGRALSMDAGAGQTKLLLDPRTKRVLGAGIVGVNAGELIAETGLALEMGANAEDIGLTPHAHPTLTETVAFAAEVAAGTITDLPPRRARR